MGPRFREVSGNRIFAWLDKSCLVSLSRPRLYASLVLVAFGKPHLDGWEMWIDLPQDVVNSPTRQPNGPEAEVEGHGLQLP